MIAQNKIANLFRAYYPELSGYLASKFNIADEAEDIAQEAFHNIIHKDNIGEIENPRAYLYQTARNIAINKIRRQGYQDDYLSTLTGTDESNIHPEREMLAKYDVDSVRKVLMKLSEKDRQTFILNKIEGKSYKEIAEELNVTVSAVEKRIMKVLHRLRKVIHDD